MTAATKTKCQWCGEKTGTRAHPDYFVCEPHWKAWGEWTKWQRKWLLAWGSLGGWFWDDYLRNNWPRTKPGSEVDPL